ncbi:MAG: signal peptide peptidase SppA [Deltaproteobacteria bacterium]|nr:signal peptide peptidase SppA [Deltaproteobacteria bacterium]
MRKHPVLFGIIILTFIGIVFFTLIYLISSAGVEKRSFALSNKVGVVKVEGFIGDSNEVVEQINQFDKDDSIKALIVRIDSPGGGVAASQEIYEAVADIKKKKKVVASMGSIAASGGYMIACAADKIVANPGTVTGSIAAVIHFANVEELMKKIGLKSSVIKSGKYKDIGSPVREMTPDEKVLMQNLVDDISDQFIDMVSRDRKIQKEDLRKIADGRVFTGRQAYRLGLVDHIGDMGYAIDLAGEMSGIKGKPEVVYAKKKGLRLWDYIFRDVFSALEEQVQSRMYRFHGIQYLSPIVNYPKSFSNDEK